MMKRSLMLTFLLATAIVACSKNSQTSLRSVVLPEIVNNGDGSLQEKLPFKIGAALSVDLLKNNSNYRNLVIKEFNSVTAENAMKMGALRPTKDTYSFADADELVAFAKAHGKRVHGHTLNWYRALPDWINNFNGSTQDWENLLKSHIDAVVGHFKGKVASWDVVNEALEEDGSYRNSIWVQKLGVGYIERAFRYARNADPNALLFYNDYGHEYSAVKRAAIIKLVTDLKAKGVPIDGIGLQMHTQVNQTDANLVAAITTAAATGLLVHVSELDIAVNPTKTKDISFTNELAQAQAAKYQLIVRTFNSIPKNQQYGITTWNVTDSDSWIPPTYNVPDWPLPFNNLYQRKAAYQGILNGAK